MGSENGSSKLAVEGGGKNGRTARRHNQRRENRGESLYFLSKTNNAVWAKSSCFGIFVLLKFAWLVKNDTPEHK